MKNYLRAMPPGILILWCYIIWYLVMVAFYFDGKITLWSNSIGLSLVVGFALVLATGPVSKARIRQQFWQVSRLFLCPFCVSSFSALTKGKGFSLLISPVMEENMVALTLCMVFCGLVYIVKRVATEFA